MMKCSLFCFKLEWAVDAELEPEGSLDYSDNCLRKQPTENLFYLREITMDDNANLCIKKDQVYISYLNEENQNLKLEVQAKNQNLKDVEREKEMLRREHDAMLQTINEVGQLSRKVRIDEVILDNLTLTSKSSPKKSHIFLRTYTRCPQKRILFDCDSHPEALD